MKAVGYRRSLPITDEASLVHVELPTPDLKPHDLLVRVEAVSINPVDVKVRMRAAPPEGQVTVLGFDAAGVVEAVGPAVTRFKKGDAVFYAGAIDRQGSNAELQAVDERIVGPKPQSLSFADAVALPLTALTAWELLFDRLRVPYASKTAGGEILIINGAGGVGSILIQMARRLTGLTVIATASRPQTQEWCRAMGAHHVIDHRAPLGEGLKSIGVAQVRYVAGLTATEQHQKAIAEVIAPQGAFGLIDDPKVLDVVPFKRKSVSVHWELMFTRSLFGTSDIAEQHHILSEVAALVDSGVLRSTARENFGAITAANLRRAHGAVESGSSIGKSVLAGF